MTARMVLDAKGFSRRLDRMGQFSKKRYRKVYKRTVDEAFRSIVHGSPRTGAPGQPVKTGRLKNSWKRRVDGPFNTAIFSDVPYAGIIEHNTRGAQLRSEVGGFHSVRITTLNLRWAMMPIVREIVADNPVP